MNRCIAVTQRKQQCKLNAINNNGDLLCFRHRKILDLGRQVLTIFDLNQNAQNVVNVKQVIKPNIPVEIPVEEDQFIPLIVEGDFECQCCFTDYPFDELIKCTKASENFKHAFCKDCIKGYIDAGLSEKKSNVNCMMSTEGCKGSYSICDIQDCVSEKTFSILEDQIIVSEIASFAIVLGDYQICPFCSKYGCIVEGDLQYVTCERCVDKSWCIKCRKSAHEDIPCGKINDPKDIDGIKRIVQETLTNALTHSCPKCNTIYTKESGCNLMTCPSCKALSCYVCGIYIMPRGGIKYWHFLGSGSQSKDAKCPLYNDGSGTSKDHGNGKFNNVRLLNECANLLKINSKEVGELMKIEMKSCDVDINKVMEIVDPYGSKPKPIAKPVAKPVAKPISKPIVNPVAKPVVNPVAKPVAKPIVNPLAKPVINPVAKPVAIKKDTECVIL